ncbi:TPR-like protein [Cylindrobasidium torrendii FP15055 ss-10]|uniref:TPR-like protein n=1 Tax=Cylindrobasidium torrendii FP15055 ss-10 TaxID=1314674 RepID=A0A0D7B0A5_9AGAR|nr:TPR-like protein [Cylindrobasidium torrendii FP15055 ss-10]
MSASDNHQNERVDVEDCLARADELKNEGNDHFRAQRWNEALVAYQSGLGQLPKRPLPRNTVVETDPYQDDSDEEESSKRTPGTPKDPTPTQEAESVATPSSPTPDIYSKPRAVLNANIAACYLKLSEHKQVVDACTEALADDPVYVKALQRRAMANEIINSWSSLTATQEDYTTLLGLLPEKSTDRRDIENKSRRLVPRLEAAQKAETAEMLDKLKGLGNSFLGNFGLSTDNFQFTPNGQGGYSMNFGR